MGDPGGPGTFAAHNERMRIFRRFHGGVARVQIAVVMKMPLYLAAADTDTGGASMYRGGIDLPVLFPTARLVPCRFSRN